ncbi:MAG: hypothetical protein K0S30_2449 [Clostridia bacterium]|nr:hypothetical protein [Clostridia bacterium]
MNTTTWIVIFLPLFIIFCIEIPRQRRIIKISNKRKRGKMIKYIGKTCIVSTGSLGTTVKGQITAVEDNWIEVNGRKGPQILNLDYITNITPIPKIN